MLPDSFQPYYLLNSTGGIINQATSGTTVNLINAPGTVGVYATPMSTGKYGNAIAAGTTTSCVIGVGSWHTVDQIAPLWGGLMEPEFTQIINWGSVIDFAYTQASPAANQVVCFGWNQSSGSTVGPQFYCGTSYNLYLEMQGNDILHFLNHQFYKTVTAFAGCCTTNCSSGCTSATVDAACVMLQWKDALNQDPYWPTFATPQVFIQNGGGKTEVFSAYDTSLNPANATYVCNTSNPSSVIASMQLTIAYVDTKFGTCTFSPTDYFAIEPLFISTVSLVLQDASPCAVNTTINTAVPNMFTQLVAGSQVRGLGQQVIRNVLGWAAYRQEFFPDSMTSVLMLRMRETENFSPILNSVNFQGLYDSIILRFNKSRPQNYSSITDQDAYCLTFYVPTGTIITNFTSLINGCLSAVGNPVQLRTI